MQKDIEKNKEKELNDFNYKILGEWFDYKASLQRMPEESIIENAQEIALKATIAKYCSNYDICKNTADWLLKQDNSLDFLYRCVNDSKYNSVSNLFTVLDELDSDINEFGASLTIKEFLLKLFNDYWIKCNTHMELRLLESWLDMDADTDNIDDFVFWGDNEGLHKTEIELLEENENTEFTLTIDDVLVRYNLEKFGEQEFKEHIISTQAHEEIHTEESKDLIDRPQCKDNISSMQAHNDIHIGKLKTQIHKIADYFGLESQSNMLIEEMTELIKAVNKYQRGLGNGQKLVRDIPFKDAYMSVVEEVADVEFMLEEIKYLMQISKPELKKIKKEKASRTLALIKENQDAEE